MHDRAYWVSEIREREKAYEDVDLTNHACGGTVPVSEVGSGSGTDPLPWTSQFRKRVRLDALPQRDVIEGTLKNVSSLRIDAKATCLRGKTVSYRIETDGPATVAFSDGRSLGFAGAGEHRGTLAAPTRGKCSRKRAVRFKLHHARGARVVRVEAYVNGKRKLRRRGRDIRSIVLRRLPTKRFVVRIVSTHSTGSQLVSTRTFKGCKKTRPRTRRHRHG
ncbi:MAG: hypothetical protein QOJ57_699 [Thermoleophilaceae bacterium]|nr:hypothetical protein [Thermoleophilaceae bacterium]